MKRLLLTSAALAMIFPGIVQADDPCASSQAPGYCYSRIADSTVGEARETTDRALALPNRLSENDFNLINNPSHLMNHGTAYLEGWAAQQYAWGGATIPLPIESLKLGVFIRRPVSERHPLFNTMIDPTATAPLSTIYNVSRIKYNAAVPYLTQLGALDANGAQARGLGNVDAFLGMSVSQSFNVGLRVGYMSASKKDVDNTASGATFSRNESSIQEPSVGLGVQIKNLGPGYLDIAGSFSLPSAKWDATTVTNTYAAKNKFAYTANALVRYVSPIGQNKLIVAAVADFYNMPVEMTDSNAAGSQTRISTASYTAFSVDAAFWQTLNETKLKVIYSVGFGYAAQGYALKTDSVSGSGGPDTTTTSVDGKYASTYAYVPLGVAIEHQTLETLKTRFGVRKNVIAPKTAEVTSNGTVTKESSSQFASDEELMLAMGLGWTPAPKVNIDLAMNANAFNLTSFFSAISARYHY